ncbi:hypothetical protein C0Q70_02489 [Pomacea canaliculata]|uniref:C3H1-type domain-containing protein n=1 Tax=Pomacea canaliculata TaxID=400727 RepID=A0A2T7PQ19_POMCA|nr:hypothetical protein C0Q70_02489 [Pomacea canaliculata]
MKLCFLADADISKYEYICETYTWTGECPNAGNCPRYHSPDRLPYLWMIQRKKGGEWRVVPSSKLLEQSFCDLCDFETLQFPEDFREMLARITGEGKNRSMTFNRLSTPSYVEAAPGTPLNFYTQWVWYWQQRDGTYTPFIPGTLQYTLEEKYRKKQYLYYLRIEKLRLVVATHSSPMIQINQDSQQSTRIVRRPVFIFTDKLEAPTMSPLLLPDVPTYTCKVPEHWASVDHFQKFETVLLDGDSPEYSEVQRHFFWTMNVNKNRIVAIFRVQNPGLWDKYCSARRAMTPKGQAPKDVKERQLFHGTPTLQAARGICTNSFDFRRSGENVGTVWGKGAYFTTARYSDKFTNPIIVASGHPVRIMFLEGFSWAYTLGHPSYAKPPESDELNML